MYAHLQQGSLPAKAGDRVTTGQPLAVLGNTGNSNAPHLHFQLMSGPSILQADGLPYVLDGTSLPSAPDAGPRRAVEDP